MERDCGRRQVKRQTRGRCVTVIVGENRFKVCVCVCVCGCFVRQAPSCTKVVVCSDHARAPSHVPPHCTSDHRPTKRPTDRLTERPSDEAYLTDAIPHITYPMHKKKIHYLSHLIVYFVHDGACLTKQRHTHTHTHTHTHCESFFSHYHRHTSSTCLSFDLSSPTVAFHPRARPPRPVPRPPPPRPVPRP